MDHLADWIQIINAGFLVALYVVFFGGVIGAAMWVFEGAFKE